MAEADSSRRTIFIIVGILSAAIVAGLIYAFYSRSGPPQPPTQLPNAIRAGAPDFERYRARIQLDSVEAFESTRALGDIVMTLQGTVRNFTGQTLDGLEVYGAVLDPNGKPIKERTVAVIPNQKPELANNETMQARILLEGISKDAVRANIKMEIVGFRFKR